MTNIILNEKAYVQDLLLSPELGKKPSETIFLLAKFFYAEGFKKKEVENKIWNYIQTCDPYSNEFLWAKPIERAAIRAKKYHLVEIPYIPITEKEIKVCRSLSSTMQQRLMFTLICLAKYGDLINETNNSWTNHPDKDVFLMANVKRSLKEQSLLMGSLKDKGLLAFSKKVDNTNSRVLCIDQEGDPVLSVTDFRNLGFQYLRYLGEPYFECKSCGLVVKKMSNRQKYCKKCGVKINSKKTSELARRS